MHIADVSHYVKEGDIIDKEAERRATSVYLVDRTIPMLPERLCNFICSLRPDEEKLAYSAIFRMNEKGEVLSWHLAHTVIRSNRRFTYEEVQYILERNGEASEEDLALPGDHPEALPEGTAPEGDYAAELIVLNRIAKTLRAQRFKTDRWPLTAPRCALRWTKRDTPFRPTSKWLRMPTNSSKSLCCWPTAAWQLK